MQQELAALGRILESPDKPLVAILGGAKVSDKLTLVEHLLDRVDALLIGGGMAFTFLASLGHAVGRSLVEPDHLDTARRTLDAARRRGVALVLPIDAVVADGLDSAQGRAVGIREIPAGQMGLDIGPRTVERFTKALTGARTIVWNGPMGVFERTPFAEARPLSTAIRDGLKRPRGVQVVVCPPFTALAAVSEILAGAPIQLGAQTCHHEPAGAHTGEVSVPMLAELGCRWILAGHSE